MDTENLEPKATEELAPNNEWQQRERRRNRLIGFFLAFLFLLIAIASIVWWILYSSYESTDNAYVGADVVVISSQQAGKVLSYQVDETDYVKRGDLLLQLDPTDFALAFDDAKAALAIAARQVRKLYEDVKQANAEVQLQEAKYHRASLDVSNRTDLLSSKAIPVEEFQHVTADLQIAEAGLQHAKHQLKAAMAALGNQPLPAHPDIEKAKIKACVQYLALKRCQIVAPVSGYIAKRSVQIGQTIGPTTELMAIIPLNSIWVQANLKETQLTKVRIGQPVDLTADIYGSAVTYHGKVVGILPGSGSVFSLLPPQNASGNWIKIVQRVPVRISLDPEEVRLHPLVMGLSMYAMINTANFEGLMLAQEPVVDVVKTTIFDIPMDDLSTQLDAIVNENLGVSGS